MPLKPGRNLCSTREAAEIYGCTMGRIRQLARAGELWCGHLHDRALVYDLDEVKRKAKIKPATGRPRTGNSQRLSGIVPATAGDSLRRQ